ncbi:sensor histidine kinase [Actinophytocola sediminis]
MPATASDRRPRRTARLRLTLLFGGLFLVLGAALLAITYLLVSVRDDPVLFVTTGDPDVWRAVDKESVRHTMSSQAAAQREATLDTLLTRSGIALTVMSAVAVVAGWLVAGRILRPVRVMADKARAISDHNLHERLNITGPDDELKDLGDTFDALLSRLDAAFDGQKSFVANASHELRTPLTLQRAAIEVALADPSATAGSLRAVCRRVLAAGEHQEHLINGLLTLARGHRGLERREPLDLAAILERVLRDRTPGPSRLDRDIGKAPVTGDARLIERLAANLVDNALRHNSPNGWVLVSTRSANGLAILRVVNSGPVIPADRIEVLFQPFQRDDTRTGHHDGQGLGLSIVAAIANAHGADVVTVPGPEGGLDITVTFR